MFTPISRPPPPYLVEGLREGHVDHKMLGSVHRSKVKNDNPLTLQALGLLKSESGSYEFCNAILNSQGQGFYRLMNLGPLGDPASCPVTG